MTERSPDFKTPLARLAYAHLFKPQTMDDGKKKYNVTLLFPKTGDMSALIKVIRDVVHAEWGDKGLEKLKNGLIKSPILDGDGTQGMNKKTGERNAGFAGHWFIRVASSEDRPPRLFNKRVLPATPDELYSGCFAYAVINAFTWEDPRNGAGVSFGVTYVQAAADGERMGGVAPPAENFFEAIADEGDAPAATTSGDGAGGLFA